MKTDIAEAAFEVWWKDRPKVFRASYPPEKEAWMAALEWESLKPSESTGGVSNVSTPKSPPSIAAPKDEGECQACRNGWVPNPDTYSGMGICPDCNGTGKVKV